MRAIRAPDGARRAAELSHEATATYDAAEQLLRSARAAATRTLDELLRLKLEVRSNELARFAQILAQLHPGEAPARAGVAAGRNAVTVDALSAVATLCGAAEQAFSRGRRALGAGPGPIADGSSAWFGASRRTSILALVGGMAMSGTLACMSDGGWSIAGSTALFGGAVVGPVLGIRRLARVSTANASLAKASTDLVLAEEAASQVRAVARALEDIEAAAAQFIRAIVATRDRLSALLDALQSRLPGSGSDPRSWATNDRASLERAVQTTRALEALLETPLLAPNGTLRLDFWRALVATSRFSREDLSGCSAA